MNKTQKLVVTLLVVSLILSAVSIALNIAILKIDVSPRGATQGSLQTSSSGVGNLELFVESGLIAGQVGGSNG